MAEKFLTEMTYTSGWSGKRKTTRRKITEEKYQRVQEIIREEPKGRPKTLLRRV